ncbi:hypothetical protein MTR67_020066 [Solanum verrucosum]|uniref:RRM domain-containing protein n=1 Tax=Solanum verrucosum TaxID=315347 RepID=A0AAF0QU38_SOLVR|nr:hypothetical protein MTR67_020066 [Solanum verrucosum]
MPQSGMPSADEVHHYLGRNDDGIGPQAVNTQSIGLADDVGVPRVMDTQSIGSAYDRYLQSLVITEAENAPTFFRRPKLAKAGGGGSKPALGVRDPLSLARGPELARAGGGGSIPALGVRDPLSLARGPELARAGGGGSIPALGVRDPLSLPRGSELARAGGGGSIPALGVRDPLSLARGPKLARAGGGGSIPALGIRDPLPSARGPKLAPNRRRRPRETLTLPPGASNTLFIEGLPSDSTRREVARYKEVRLVKRDSKYPAEDPLILGFVDFINPECAATALRALQGYIMDEDGIHSTYLRLQFSKFPDRRFGGRGKR